MKKKLRFLDSDVNSKEIIAQYSAFLDLCGGALYGISYCWMGDHWTLFDEGFDYIFFYFCVLSLLSLDTVFVLI